METRDHAILTNVSHEGEANIKSILKENPTNFFIDKTSLSLLDRTNNQGFTW